MNHAYGIRVRKAFVSEHNWYELNACDGRLFLAFGVFLLAFAYVGKDLAPPPTSLWTPVFMVAPLVAIILILVLINNFALRLPE